MEHSQAAIGPIREVSWESVAEAFQSRLNPSWSDVETLIRQLETVQSGSIFLKAANGNTLSIGGDRGKGYLVSVSTTQGDYYLLAPHSKRKGIQNLVIGFQPSEYPSRIIVNPDAALEAARNYFNTGRIEDSEDWTPDGNSIEQ